MCTYLFWSKSELINKIKDLELKNMTLEHILSIKEEENKIKDEIIEKYKIKIQKNNKTTNSTSTYLWR